MAEPETKMPERDVRETDVPKKNVREKSTPELMSDLVNEFTRLVNAEVALAKAELTEKISTAGQAAGLFSGAMIAGLMTLGAATGLAIIALALVVPAWLSALIVTVVWGLIAAVLVLTGKQRAQAAMPPVPEKTIQTIKEDAQWARKPIRLGRK